MGIVNWTPESVRACCLGTLVRTAVEYRHAFAKLTCVQSAESQLLRSQLGAGLRLLEGELERRHLDLKGRYKERGDLPLQIAS